MIAFLAAADTHGAGAVERHETHGALVFLAGDRAYKLKRAVKFPYMDFSTRERRRDACEKELQVNRRTAPELYLEVSPVVRQAGGPLQLGGEGEVLDWVVVMRRFATESLLERRRQAGKLDAPLLRRLAETIAAFHGSIEAVPGFGAANGLADVVTKNLTVIKGMTGRVFEAERVERLARQVWHLLDRLGPMLDARRDAGLVRRCHGDLHLNNICVLEGRPVLFDAIEFNDDFACIDVFYDLAFLLMDLDRHGLRDFANLVLNRYLEIRQDYAGLATLPLFLSTRAAIRAHVTVSTTVAKGQPDDPARLAEARRLLDLAIAYSEPPPPRLVAIGGLSGTGKSSVARALAPSGGPSPGAVVLRSDVIRKRLMNVPETTRLPESAYEPGVTVRVFASLAETAGVALTAGHAVVADAVYGDPGQRAAIAAVARAAGVPFAGFWLEAPRDVLEARVADRQGDASDATVEVLRRQVQGITPPADWLRIDAIRPVADIALELNRLLDESRIEDLPGLNAVVLRPVRPGDEPALQRFFDRMTAEDIRLRFFAPLRELPEQHLARLVDLDRERELACILESPDGILGIARIAADAQGRRAEFAVTVRSDLQGRGLGTHLLRRLVTHARERGLEEIYGDILAENATMIAICRDLGFEIQPLPETKDIVRATRRL